MFSMLPGSYSMVCAGGAVVGGAGGVVVGGTVAGATVAGGAVVGGTVVGGRVVGGCVVVSTGGAAVGGGSVAMLGAVSTNIAIPANSRRVTIVRGLLGLRLVDIDPPRSAYNANDRPYWGSGRRFLVYQFWFQSHKFVKPMF